LASACELLVQVKPVMPALYFLDAVTMQNSKTRARISFLLLLFFGTLCSSMIIPFMGFFLVNGLGQEPWIISVYSVLALCLTVSANRIFAGRIDAGERVFPLIGVAALGYVIASFALSLSPALWTVLTVGVIGFGISSSAVSTMFSVGGSLAERHQIERSRFNAHMRATTSTAWMVGPAVTFLIADLVGMETVFSVSLGVSLIWVGLWFWTLPPDMRAPAKDLSGTSPAKGASSTGMWLAVAFVFSLSSAHSLTFTSLPLFYVQEVGLPKFAPGLAFSTKTLVEVFAIFSTPAIIVRFGIWRPLMATSLLAVVTIQVLAAVHTLPQMLAAAALEGLYYGFYASLGISFVQSFAEDRPAQATALYWNALLISGLLAGPAVGFIAQVYDFQTVIRVASAVACFAVVVLLVGRRSGRAAVE